MDDLVAVPLDTGAFARDVAAMRAELQGALGAGAERAGDAIERGLLRAVRTGKLGFEDLKRTALAALAEIAALQVRQGLSAAFGGSGTGATLAGVAASLLGLPGRAGGGPVSPGRGYLVGERGPELFVPTASGRVEATPAQASRTVHVSITLNAPGGSEARALERSSRQVARAVKSALMRAEG